MRQQYIITMTCLILCACTVGPNYIKTESNINPQWHSASKKQKQAASEQVTIAWWRQFKDPLLNQYIQTLVCTNLDVQSALLRIEQARAIRGIDTSDAYPQIGSRASVTNERISKTGRALGSLPPNLPGISLIPLKRDVYEPRFDMSWELDVFGRIRRINEARTADIAAAIENSRAIKQSLMAELGRNYFQLRSLQEQRLILKKNIEIQTKRAQISTEQRKAGAVDDLAEDSAYIALKTQEAQLPLLNSQIQAKAYQIAVLLGKPPETLSAELNKVKTLPQASPSVKTGLRSELLRRRPDVRASERQIAVASAEIGVAVADLFPRFSLNGYYGVESLFWKDLFSKPNQIWTIGPFMQWAILQGGQIQQNIKLKKIQFHEKVIQYEKTVLLALQEAETTLDQYNKAQQSLNLLKLAQRKASQSMQLASQRFEAGEDGINALLNAKESLLNAQLNLVNSRSDNIDKLILFYKALGGGWQAFDSPQTVGKGLKKPNT